MAAPSAGDPGVIFAIFLKILIQESPSLQRQAANVYETFSFSETSSNEGETWTSTIYQTVTSLWTSTMSPYTT